MSTHYGIVHMLTNSPRENVVVEFSSDVACGAQIRVWSDDFDPATGQARVTSKTLTVPAGGYAQWQASVQSLFATASGKTAFLEAQCSEPAMMTIRQTSSAGRVLLASPPREFPKPCICASCSSRGVVTTTGSLFRFPLGILGQGAWALIGNPNPSPVDIIVRFGGSTSPMARQKNVAGCQAAAVPLTTPNTQVIIESTSEVFVLLAVDAGKVEQTWIPPSG